MPNDAEPEPIADRPVVEMRDITISFPGVKALQNVSFRLFPGEVHALMGENGAGKSTLIKALTGVYAIDSGTISVKGNDVAVLRARAGAAGRHRDRLPGGQPGHQPDGRGEHHARPGAAPAWADRLAADAQTRRQRAAQVSTWTSIPDRCSARTRSPSSNWWPSAGRSTSTPMCWCWTNRRRRWTSRKSPN